MQTNLALLPRRTFLRFGVTAALLFTTVPLAFPAHAADTVPTIWLIGDSTVKNGTKGQQGWGDPFAAYFDTAKVKVMNRARGGRSSRTYLTEKLWDDVLAQVKPGDYVLMQFGHNDGGSLNDPRERASVKGNGDGAQEVTGKTSGKKETVYSYGWYLRRYIADTRAKGATPIVLSFVPRNIWQGDKVGRGTGSYTTWAEEAAKQGGAAFVNLNEIIAQRYDTIGKDKTAAYFATPDHTHTNPDGAKFNAECVVSGLKALPGSPFLPLLSEQGTAVTPAASTLVVGATTSAKE